MPRSTPFTAATNASQASETKISKMPINACSCLFISSVSICWLSTNSGRTAEDDQHPVTSFICQNYSIVQPLCSNIQFLVCGNDSQQQNKTILDWMSAIVDVGKLLVWHWYVAGDGHEVQSFGLRVDQCGAYAVHLNF